MKITPQLANNRFEDIHRMLNLIQEIANKELRDSHATDRENRDKWLDALCEACKAGENARCKARDYTVMPV